MKKSTATYGRIGAPSVPGVIRVGLKFTVYSRNLTGKQRGLITAKRNFATEEAANIFFNGLQPDERI